jgi:hypothetical protein
LVKTLSSNSIQEAQGGWQHPLALRINVCIGHDQLHNHGNALDHEPALVLRERHPATGGYIPAANDPRYLRYRLASDHQFKTFTRGDGAQLSDVACTKSRCFAQKALP